MTLTDAIATGKRVAEMLDQPAWVYPQNGAYQVSCMDWSQLSPLQQQNVVQVILPNGRVFGRWTKEA